MIIVCRSSLALRHSGTHITTYKNRDNPLDDAALPNPTLGIDPVLAAVGFSGDRVEGMTPSPDCSLVDTPFLARGTHIHD
jgi:hypothetical protein